MEPGDALPSPPLPASAAVTGTEWRWGGRVVLVALAIFLLVRLPVAAEYFIYHYDEHFYTDGALDMLRSGAYLSPRYADGRPRFNKPLLTYWVIAGSFSALGITPLAARLPFLLVGLGIIWMTWRLARSMLEDAGEALLAPLFLISNFTFLGHVGFSITDGLLTLAVLTSHYGFMRMLLKGESRGMVPYMAYGGAGLAVATKGIPGLLPVAFAWGYRWWIRRKARAGADGIPASIDAAGPSLFHLPAILVGLFLGTGWIFALWAVHGEAFWSGFLYDQAGRRFVNSRWYMAIYFYPTNLPYVFLPWSLPLLLVFTRHRKALFDHVRSRKYFYAYVFGVLALTYLFLLPLNIIRSRYLMTIYPLFAVFLAGWTHCASRLVPLDRYWRVLAWTLLGVAAVCGLVLFGRLSGHAPRAAWGGLVLIGASVVGAVLLVRSRRAAVPVLSLGAVILLSAFDVLTGPFIHMAPSEELTAELEKHRLERPVLALGREVMRELPGHVRVLSGGRVRFDYAALVQPPDSQPPVVLFKESARPNLDFSAYDLYSVGYGYIRCRKRVLFLNGRAGHRPLGLLCAVTGHLDAFRRDHSRRYWLAVTKDVSRLKEMASWPDRPDGMGPGGEEEEGAPP